MSGWSQIQTHAATLTIEHTKWMQTNRFSRYSLFNNSSNPSTPSNFGCSFQAIFTYNRSTSEHQNKSNIFVLDIRTFSRVQYRLSAVNKSFANFALHSNLRKRTKQSIENFNNKWLFRESVHFLAVFIFFFNFSFVCCQTIARFDVQINV